MVAAMSDLFSSWSFEIVIGLLQCLVYLAPGLLR